MTRLYSEHVVCDLCHRQPPWGWLYRCTQDRELALTEAIERGADTTAFDSIGEVLSRDVRPAKRGPEARSDKYSFFNELSRDDLACYAPEQLSMIMQQREKVSILSSGVLRGLGVPMC